jgi:H+/Cl- antiporter ClcA
VNVGRAQGQELKAMADADKPKQAYRAVMFVTSSIGIALFCLVHQFYTFPTKLGEIEPTWVLTPLFILPVLIGLWITKRIGIPGLIFLTPAVTGAHYLAQTLGILTLTVMPDSKANELMTFTLIGAVAGAIGAAVSFIAFAILGRTLRKVTHLKLYAVSTAGLALTGALGFLSMMLIEPTSNKWILNLYLPWQVAFTLAIAKIFHARLS